MKAALMIFFFPLMSQALGLSSYQLCVQETQKIHDRVISAKCVWDSSTETPPVPDLPVAPDAVPWPGVRTFFQYFPGKTPEAYCMGVFRCAIGGREQHFDRVFCQVGLSEIPNASANLPNSCRNKLVTPHCKFSKLAIDLAQCANPRPPLPHNFPHGKVPMRLPANIEPTQKTSKEPMPKLHPPPTGEILPADKIRGNPTGT